MPTYLALSQTLRSKAGLSGTGPVSVVGRTGIELRLVNGIADAWVRIQDNPKDWKWMWGDYLAPAPGGAPLQTIVNTTDYPLTDVQKVHKKSFRSYLTSDGVSDRQRMTYVDYDKFQASYGVVDAAASRPIVVTELPNGNLRVHPKSDKIYSIEFETQKIPQVLAADADIPDMPSRFHLLIITEALLEFGGLDDAPEVIASALQIGGNDGSNGRPATGLWRSLIWDQELRKDGQMTVVPE